MIASVLLPTRERPELCAKSVASLGDGDFEVLVYVDDDDPCLEDYRTWANQTDRVTLFVQPRMTYYRFEEMINLLAEASKGDWLLLWNDDAVMHGDWLTPLTLRDSKRVSVVRWGTYGMNLFPAITRKMYELQGYFSLSPHCDSWVEDISKLLKCEINIETVEVEHIRDQLNDATKQHSAGAYAVTSPKHSSDELKLKLLHVTDKLREYV